jgi:hypothetical protein
MKVYKNSEQMPFAAVERPRQQQLFPILNRKTDQNRLAFVVSCRWRGRATTAKGISFHKKPSKSECVCFVIKSGMTPVRVR